MEVRPSTVRDRDAVRGAVVLDHVGVVDRHELAARVEVVDRVAALAHEVGDEPVGVGHRHLRAVDEARLHVLPLLGVALPRRVAQRAQLELVVPGFPIAQVALGLAASVGTFDGPVVLGPKALLEVMPAATARSRRDGRNDHQHHHDGDDDPDPGVHGWFPLG